MKNILHSVPKSLVFWFFLIFILILKSNINPLLYSQNNNDFNNNNNVLTKEDSIYSINLLKNRIDNAIAKYKLTQTKYSIAIYSLDNNRFFYQKDIDLPLIPASNTKLITSFVALSYLGSNYQIKTKITTDAQKIENGVVYGNLYIVGAGDPLLTVPDIELIADELNLMGINTIEGNIYADASFFDNLTNRMIYAGDNDEVEPLPPVTGLSLERNTATVYLNSANSRVRTQIIPASNGFRIENLGRIRTYAPAKKPILKKNVKSKKINSKKKAFLNDIPKNEDLKSYDYNDLSLHNTIKFSEEKDIKYQFGGAYPIIYYCAAISSAISNSISVSQRFDKNGIQTFVVSGLMAPNTSATYSFFIRNPELVIAGVFKDRLLSGGITVKGQIGQISNKENNKSNKKLLYEFHRPMIELLYPINKNSDNYMAENLFKLVGASYNSSQNTAKSSQEITKKIFDSLQIPCKLYMINDGSGLSRRNLFTTEAFIAILKNISNSPYSAIFDSTLSIAGIDGTLRKRMVSTKAQNNLHAKTGTHGNVSALSGYVKTNNREKIAFSFLFNGACLGKYKQLEDEIGIIISEFEYTKAK